jgi:hypothetical protein
MEFAYWHSALSSRSRSRSGYHEIVPPILHDMKTWTDRTGHARLRSFTDNNGNFWIEQNPAKRSKWAKFVQEGHEMAWEFAPGGGYTGRMLIDREIYTPSEATKKFLQLQTHS